MFVHELLRRSAHDNPERSALETPTRRWCYAELHTEVVALSEYLVSAGLEAGDRVAIDLGNAGEAVISIWATLRAGGCFVVLDATSPETTFAALLVDFRPRILITRPGRLNSLRARPPVETVVVLDGEVARSEAPLDGSSGALPHGSFAGPVAPPPRGAVSFAHAIASAPHGLPMPELSDPEGTLANLVYTSGSTGRPKGVMMTHRSMGAAIDAISTYLDGSANERMLCLLPLSFDYGLYQCFLAAARGGCLVLRDGFGFPGELLELLREAAITTLPGVPTLFALLLQLDSFGARSLPALRKFTNTGAALPPSQVVALRHRFPDARLFLMYGLTECKRVSYLPPDQVDRHPDSVGIPMKSCRVAVVDASGKRVEAGRIGELVVAGTNVMRGYWERPKETAQVLRSGPWGSEMCLYTGDLFRQDAAGRLSFVARKDDVLKSRGEKVAPTEVEAVLLGMPGIADAAVIGVEHPVLGQAIHAVVVLEVDANPTEGAVLRHCSSRLESFKQPGSITFVDVLPRNSRGKVDKEQLRERARRPHQKTE